MAKTRTRAGGTTGFEQWRPVERPPVIPCEAKGGPHAGPHNRCQHPTALPEGRVACAGDPSCPYRIPARLGIRYCPWHTDFDLSYDPARQFAELMGDA